MINIMIHNPAAFIQLVIMKRGAGQCRRGFCLPGAWCAGGQAEEERRGATRRGAEQMKGGEEKRERRDSEEERRREEREERVTKR